MISGNEQRCESPSRDLILMFDSCGFGQFMDEEIRSLILEFSQDLCCPLDLLKDRRFKRSIRVKSLVFFFPSAGKIKFPSPGSGKAEF